MSNVQRNINENQKVIAEMKEAKKEQVLTNGYKRAEDEYVHKNPIASDSNNEKRISKAQTRAEGKVKDERIKRRRDIREKIKALFIHYFQRGKNIEWSNGCMEIRAEKIDEKISRFAFACSVRNRSSEAEI